MYELTDRQTCTSQYFAPFTYLPGRIKSRYNTVKKRQFNWKLCSFVKEIRQIMLVFVIQA